MRISTLSFSALAMVVAMVEASPVLAALGGTAGVVIPYAGKLEQNGALITGSFDFQFQVMPDAVTGTPCEIKTVNAVAVTNGEFALTIPALTEACVKGKDVHLIVGVRTAGGGGFTTLGKQRMTPTLSALTSGNGDFNTGATVQGASGTITGGLTAGSMQTGTLNSTGGVSALGTVLAGNITMRNGGIFHLFPVSFDTIGIRDWKMEARDDGKIYFTAFDAVVHEEVSFDSGLNSATSIRARRGIVASTTPDIAETIAAAKNVEAADVVCADPLNAEHVVRCTHDARGVLGVVSDGTSSFMINSHANDASASLTGAPLVLAGRVPVKVSLEGGPIRIGDELALSSTPGVAMRATGTGPVVGIALAAFDGSSKKSGTVLCFVKVAEGNIRALAQRQAEDNAELKQHIAELEARLSALEARFAAIEPKATLTSRNP